MVSNENYCRLFLCFSVKTSLKTLINLCVIKFQISGLKSIRIPIFSIIFRIFLESKSPYSVIHSWYLKSKKNFSKKREKQQRFQDYFVKVVPFPNQFYSISFTKKKKILLFSLLCNIYDIRLAKPVRIIPLKHQNTLNKSEMKGKRRKKNLLAWRKKGEIETVYKWNRASLANSDRMGQVRLSC